MAELRRQKGISQEDLALECGLARSYVSGVERGLRNVGLLNIVKLADAIGVHPSELFKSLESDGKSPKK